MDTHDDWDEVLFESMPAASSQTDDPASVDDWDDMFDTDNAAPALISEHEPQPVVSQPDLEVFVRRPGKGKGRGGGRPVGSRVYREYAAAFVAANRNQELQEDQELPLVATDSMAHARLALAKKRAENKKQTVETSSGRQVTLQHDVQQQLAKHGPVQDMFSVGSDLHQDLLSCVVSALRLRQPQDMKDPLIEHLRTTPMTTRSLKAVEEKTQQTKVGEKIIAITAAVLELSYFMWGMFLSFVCRLCSRKDNGDPPSCEPVLLLVKMRYDETPTKVRVADPGCSYAPQTDSHTADSVDLAAMIKALPVEQSSTRAKIFQSELSLGCLLKSLDDSDQHPYKWTFGRLPTALQVLDDGTGESIRAGLFDILRRVPELERASNLFPLALRHSCCDRYTGNFKAERLLDKDFPFLKSVPFTCDVHKLQSVVESATNPFSNDVAGILSIGVGISPDIGCVKTMRHIIARVLANRLVIYYNDPPPECAAQRKQHLDLFLPVKKVSHPGKHFSIRQVLKRRWIISYFLNGDLQGKEVQHYCTYSCCASPAMTMRNMTTFLTWALVPYKCPKFARSRWTNWVESVEWTGLLAGIHNLLEEVILAYTGGPRSTQTVSESPAAAGVLPVNQAEQDEWDDMLQLQSSSQPALGSAKPKQGEKDSGEVLEPLEAPPATEGEVPKNQDWADFNEKQRGNARQWVSSLPYPRLVVLRVVSGVLLALMYRFLSLGGLPWEKTQQARVAAGHSRQYAIQIAADGRDVQNAMKDLHAILSSPIACLPQSMVTPKLKTMKFLAVSSALCSLHVLLRLPREGCPYLLFKCLAGCIDLVAGVPECMWDPLTHIIRSRYDPCLQFSSGI